MIDIASVAIRLALYVDLLLVFGLVAFTIYALPDGGNPLPSVRRTIGMGALAGVVLSAVGLIVVAAAMNGVALRDVDLTMVASVATDTATGIATKVRIAALLMVAGLAALSDGVRLARLAMMMCGGIAVLSLTWLAHGAADDGSRGIIHLAADAIHLLAAGIWLGALAGLLLMLLRPVARSDDDHVRRSHAALAGFATVGTITVGLIVLTGMVNSWFLVGPANFWSVGKSVYGQLLLAKLGLFAMMLALAAGNRFKLTSALVSSADVSASVRALRLSLTIETTCAIGVLALVALLGTLAPPISGQ